jgi:hypothetical protein
LHVHAFPTNELFSWQSIAFHWALFEIDERTMNDKAFVGCRAQLKDTYTIGSVRTKWLKKTTYNVDNLTYIDLIEHFVSFEAAEQAVPVLFAFSSNTWMLRPMPFSVF